MHAFRNLFRYARTLKNACRVPRLRLICRDGWVLTLVVPTALAHAGVLSGSVTHPNTLALPDGAILQAQLVDAAHPDVAAEPLADSRRMIANGAPYTFALAVDPNWLEPPYLPQLRVTVSQAGRVVLQSAEDVRVTPRMLEVGVRVAVNVVVDADREDGAGARLSCRGNEPFWRLDLDAGVATVTSLASAWPVVGTFAGQSRVLDWAQPRQIVWRGGAPLTEAFILLARAEPCHDTMADRAPYGWSATLVGPGGETRLGCCDDAS